MRANAQQARDRHRAGKRARSRVHLQLAATRSRWSCWSREEDAASARAQLEDDMGVAMPAEGDAGGGQARAVPVAVVRRSRGQRAARVRGGRRAGRPGGVCGSALPPRPACGAAAACTCGGPWSSRAVQTPPQAVEPSRLEGTNCESSSHACAWPCNLKLHTKLDRNTQACLGESRAVRLYNESSVTMQCTASCVGYLCHPVRRGG